jgi:hypothetical protein
MAVNLAIWISIDFFDVLATLSALFSGAARKRGETGIW